jgi:hypothetical protein
VPTDGNSILKEIGIGERLLSPSEPTAVRGVSIRVTRTNISTVHADKTPGGLKPATKDPKTISGESIFSEVEIAGLNAGTKQK